jgi:hypothetical protein
MILLSRSYDGYLANTTVQFPTPTEASLVASGSGSFSAGPVTPGNVSPVSAFSGRVGIAPGGSSVVITSPQITGESKVCAYLSNLAADGTATSITRISCLSGVGTLPGTCTIFLNAAATAAVAIDWAITGQIGLINRN